jgi:hypothetical protein
MTTDATDVTAIVTTTGYPAVIVKAVLEQLTVTRRLFVLPRALRVANFTGLHAFRHQTRGDNVSHLEREGTTQAIYGIPVTTAWCGLRAIAPVVEPADSTDHVCTTCAQLAREQATEAPVVAATIDDAGDVAAEEHAAMTRATSEQHDEAPEAPPIAAAARAVAHAAPPVREPAVDASTKRPRARPRAAF